MPKENVLPDLPVGTRFGKLTVTGASANNERGARCVPCRCDCGADVFPEFYGLRTGRYVSCGRCNMVFVKPGDKYGLWTVVDEEHRGGKNSRRRMVRCRCEGCGEEHDVCIPDMVNGKSRSCFKCSKARPIQYEDNGEFIIATTPNGKQFIFDREDLAVVSCYQWGVAKRNVVASVWSTDRLVNEAVLLHRVIMNPPSGYVVDHINGDPTNNRRSNLRICSQKQNMQNQGKRPHNTSGYKGVKRAGNKWVAKVSGRIIGRFDTAEEAAHAYDDESRRLYGEFACVNFPRPGERSAITGKILPLIYAVDTNGVKTSYDDGLDDDFAAVV